MIRSSCDSVSGTYPTSRPEDDTNEGGSGAGEGMGEGRGGKRGKDDGHAVPHSANTTERLMYKNECSFGCSITALAALAAIADYPIKKHSHRWAPARKLK